MKRWLAVVGVLLTITGGMLLYRGGAVSAEEAISGAFPNSSFLATTPIPQGQLVWFTADGKQRVALVSQDSTVWKVEATREVPYSQSPSEVAWAVWSPKKVWSLFIAQAPPNVKEVRVDGQSATSLSENAGIWLLSTESYLRPPIDIEAYDGDGKLVWRY